MSDYDIMAAQIDDLGDEITGLETLIREIGERHGFHWEPDRSPRSMLAKLSNRITLLERDASNRPSSVVECPHCHDEVDVRKARGL